MNASFQPELVIDGIAALSGDCQLKTVFEFASADDMRRGEEMLSASCEAFVTAGGLGGFAMAGRMHPEGIMAAWGGMHAREQQADLQFRAVTIDPKAFQAARKFKRAFAAVVSASGEGTLRVVRLGSMTRS